MDEATIRRHHEAGDHDAATTAALKAYGPEVLGLLMALHRDETQASDAFALFGERLWQSLPGFRWQCSLRTWAYRIARAASVDQRRADRRRARRQVGLSAGVSQVAAEVRTATLTYLRTEKRSAIQQLRDELPADDQTLLVLRIDREMAWLDLATVFLADQEIDHDKAALVRESARLRKRFQLVKKRLLETARARGIVRSEPRER